MYIERDIKNPWYIYTVENCGCGCGCGWVHSLSHVQLTLCNPMDYNPPGSSVHGVFQARKVEWVAISYSRGSSQSWDRVCVSCIDGILYYCITWEAHGGILLSYKKKMPFAATWMNLEITILSQTKRNIICHLYVASKKNDIN